MARVASLIAWALAAAAPAQPVPRVPAELGAVPRVDVVVDEALPVDALRRLARPGIVAWLRTGSNTLKDSTVENLGRFDSAYVELRAPLKPVDARVLARLPRVGVWARTGELAGLVGRAPGARALAVDVEAPLAPAVTGALAAARPAVVRVHVTRAMDVLAWGEVRALPGKKWIIGAPQSAVAVRCVPRDGDPALEVHLAYLLAVGRDVFPCGKGTRVVVNPDVDPALVRPVVVADPSAALVVEVGADDARATRTAQLLDELGYGPFR